MKRTAATRVLSVLLVTAGGAVCQSPSPSVDLPGGVQSYGPNVAEALREPRLQKSISNASSVRCPEQVEKLYGLGRDGRPPPSFGAFGINLCVLGKKSEYPARGARPSFAILHPVALQKEPNPLFFKYQYPSLLEHPSWLKEEPRYLASTSNGFLGRASYAASLVLITRDGPGKVKSTHRICSACW